MNVKKIALPLMLTVATTGAGIVQSYKNKNNQHEIIETASKNTNPLSNSADALTATLFGSLCFWRKRKDENTTPNQKIVIKDLNEAQTLALYKNVKKRAKKYEHIDSHQVDYSIKIEPKKSKQLPPPRELDPEIERSDSALANYVKEAHNAAHDIYNMTEGLIPFTNAVNSIFEMNKSHNRPYALQAAEALLNNPKLMNNKNVQFYFTSIYSALEDFNGRGLGYPKENCQYFVDFIYDLTSEKNAPIFENKNVQNCLGSMLTYLATMSRPYSEKEYYENFTKFLEFLRTNPEYSSHPFLSTYIKNVDCYYDECVEQIKNGCANKKYVTFKEPELGPL